MAGQHYQVVEPVSGHHLLYQRLIVVAVSYLAMKMVAATARTKNLQRESLPWIDCWARAKTALLVLPQPSPPQPTPPHRRTTPPLACLPLRSMAQHLPRIELMAPSGRRKHPAHLLLHLMDQRLPQIRLLASSRRKHQ